MSVSVRSRLPSFGPSVHLFLARNRWIRRCAVCVLAAAVGAAVESQLDRLERERAEWGETADLAVATSASAPGEVIDAELRTLPARAVPDDALTEVPDGATARRRVGAGEILVAADITLAIGPAATASTGEVVVTMEYATASDADVGVEIEIYSDGLVLAEQGRIVGVDPGVVHVAVERTAGPNVADAALRRSATLAFVGRG